MAEQQQQVKPGGHYSGANPVPTVRKFIENLDKDKKSRDKKLDEEMAAQQKQTASGDAVAHKPQKRGIEGTQKTVTDPTTGNQVVIEDVDKATMAQVENPQVGVHEIMFTAHVLIGHSCPFPTLICRKTPYAQIPSLHHSSQLTEFRPSRQTPRNRKQTTNMLRMLPPLRTLSPRVLPLTCPFTAKRRTSSSTPLRQ
jgi:hypothetical protein